MKILHTADWHIGQQFYDYDRSFEHQQFLNWLLALLKEEQFELLLISGDIFDTANPSAASIRMFYEFLKSAIDKNPDLQIIITAGNHDSAHRLESALPLLQGRNVQIVGHLERSQNGDINYNKFIIPIKGKKNETIAYCLAIPFIKLGDYPGNDYNQGVHKIYQESFDYLKTINTKTLPVIGMGHLHASKSELSDMDESERRIIGGLEGVSLSSFDKKFAYLALGHIHKAQKIGGKENVRYCGSPLPMSFSERKYKHQVIAFDILEGLAKNIRAIEIPITIPLLSVPEKAADIDTVLNELAKLSEAKENPHLAPYLEVRLLLKGPEPNNRHKIEKALENKFVKLARINASTEKQISKNIAENIDPELLQKLKPIDILEKLYSQKYNQELPQALKQIFEKTETEIRSSEQ